MERVELLLKHRDRTKPIRFNDGLVAAFHSMDPQLVITSPNSKKILEPPIGSTRDVVRREDGFYADDDYILCPQPWNRKHSHLCVIPLEPDNSLTGRYWLERIMWSRIAAEDVCLEGAGRHKTYHTTPGTLVPRFFEELKISSYRLQRRFNGFKTTFALKGNVVELGDAYICIIDVCLLALDVARPFRDIVRAVAEIQRAWLSCSALMDYMEIYKPRMMAGGVAEPVVANVIGACTDNADAARMLFHAGIPVYYTRHVSDIGTSNILSVVKAISNTGSFSRRDANPPYSMIYMGPAHTDTKFDSILEAARTVFTGGEVFSRGVHYGEQYKSSWTLGSSLSSHRIQPSRQDEVRRDRGPLDRQGRSKFRSESSVIWRPIPEGRYSPEPISWWLEQIRHVDAKHPERSHHRSHPPHCHIVPPPQIFLKADGSLRTREFSQWLHFRRSWFRRCIANPQGIQPVSISIWKELLCFALHRRPWNAADSPKTKLGADRKAGWELLTDTMDQFGEVGSKPYIVGDEDAPEECAIRESLWKLTEICFRYELQHIDHECDNSKPRSENYSHFNEYQLALIKHGNDRYRLLKNISHTPGIFEIDVDVANRGLASTTLHERFERMHALWVAMESWKLCKPEGWHTMEAGLMMRSAKSRAWEEMVVRYYLQSGFNVLGYVPMMPYRLLSSKDL